MSDLGPSTQDPVQRAERSPLWVAAVAATALALPAAFLIVTGANAGRAAFDSTAYHLRFIRDLAAQFPDFDISNPLTVTTPGYHILLALFARAGGDSLEALRFASLAIGCAFVAIVAAWFGRRARRAEAVVLSLPLCASIYVIGAAAWTAPDNLAWLLVVSILWLALMDRRGSTRLVIACVLLVALACVRQVHVWAAAIIWIAAFADARADGRTLGAALMRTALWGVATLPAFVALWAFVQHWGGLVPPRFQHEVQGVNLATIPFILLQVAILSLGFLPWCWNALARAWSAHRTVLVLAALAALAAAAVPETTASFEAGRFSGWWGIVARAPVIGGHTSVVLLAAAPVGAVVLLSLLLGLRDRDRAILGVAFVAFAAAVTSNYYCWQRYHEPLLLCFIPACILLQERRCELRGSAGYVPPIALALVLGAISASGFRGDPLPIDTLPSQRHWAPTDHFAPAVAEEAKRGP